MIISEKSKELADAHFIINDTDRAIWAEELEDFVPDTVFDAHTHIWSEKNALPETASSPLRLEVDAETLQQWYRQLFPGRKMGFMLLGSPIPGIDFDRDREWCAAEAKRLPDTVCGVLVTPQSDPEKLAADAARLGFRALKPYLIFAPKTTFCTISEMIPEPLIEVADALGLFIVLHVSRPECFNDPENQRQLKYFTGRYPHVTWQLAHCARSFNGILLEKSIHILKHLDHVCYDLSAVCDPYTFYLLFQYEDHARLMYGSDNICAGCMRGSYASFGRSWGLFPPDGRAGTTLVCYEQLRAMRRGALMAELPESDLRKIFWDNAVRIYGLQNR